MLVDDSDDEGDRSEGGKVGSSAKPREASPIAPVVEHPWFGPLFTVLILLNTLVLAMEFDGMSDTYADVLSSFNLALSVSFMVEMVLKIARLGPRDRQRLVQHL